MQRVLRNGAIISGRSHRLIVMVLQAEQDRTEGVIQGGCVVAGSSEEGVRFRSWEYRCPPSLPPSFLLPGYFLALNLAPGPSLVPAILSLSCSGTDRLLYMTLK